MSGPLATTVCGAGRGIVLVHGFTQTGRSWDRIARELTADHRVVTVDAPGHGASAAIVTDLPGSAELLARTCGRATYVGYSMGARMCLHLALDRPELVERLVLLGATGGIDDDDERAARRASDEALAEALERDGVDAFLDRWLANPMFAGLPNDPTDVAERRSNTAAGLAASLRLCGTGTQVPLWSRLATLEMPVLVMAGDRDDRFCVLGRRLVDSIGANATLATIPAAGHAAHLEQPDTFVSVLRGWLAQTGGDTSPGSRYTKP